MTTARREFLQTLLALGVVPALPHSPSIRADAGAWFDEEQAKAVNPDFDPEAFNFWKGFLDKPADPVGPSVAKHRGGEPDPRPVVYHYGAEKTIRNAIELDTKGLIADGDVAVSLNASTIRIARQHQDLFDSVQNAQVRVDLHQKAGMLPFMEAMAYTLVSGMNAVKTARESSAVVTSGGGGGGRGAKGGQAPAPPPSSGGRRGGGSIQTLSMDSAVAWQKMQNIVLPDGEGLLALNLEAQKKESLLCRVLQFVVRETNMFAPLISFPGIALYGLQSFNMLYGAIHARPVRIIETAPIRAFATQAAVEKTGAPGAARGIILRSGTYILIRADDAANIGTLDGYKVAQGVIVPMNTDAKQLEAAALETLQDVTYVTFDVSVSPTRILAGTGRKG